MKIAIIGTGTVGTTLGRSWAKKGYEVIFGSRQPEREDVLALVAEVGERASATTPAEAAAEADVVVLATPWNATEAAVKDLGVLNDKVLIDCTNPIAPGLQLAVGKDVSGAEKVAAWASGGRVVKAFNTTGVENMADPDYNGTPATMFICGDDAGARRLAAELAEALGFDVADVGDLQGARFLEPMALAWIRLANSQREGRNIAFKLLRR